MRIFIVVVYTAFNFVAVYTNFHISISLSLLNLYLKIKKIRGASIVRKKTGQKKCEKNKNQICPIQKKRTKKPGEKKTKIV